MLLENAINFFLFLALFLLVINETRYVLFLLHSPHRSYRKPFYSILFNHIKPALVNYIYKIELKVIIHGKKNLLLHNRLRNKTFCLKIATISDKTACKSCLSVKVIVVLHIDHRCSFLHSNVRRTTIGRNQLTWWRIWN